MTKISHMSTTRRRLASASLPKARHDLPVLSSTTTKDEEERTLITPIDIGFGIVIL